MRKLTPQQKYDLIYKDHSNNRYFQDNPTYFCEVLDILKKNNLHVKGLQRYLMHSKNYIVKWLESYTPELSDSFYTMTTKCYWMLYDLKEYPKCVVCGNPIAKKRNTKLFELYPKTCCSECRYLDDSLWKSVKLTKKLKYGKDHYMEFGQPEFKQRVAELHDGNQNWNNPDKNKITCLDRYGYEYPAQVPEIKQKIQKTLIDNYGVSCIFMLPEFHEYSKQICLDRYGYENPAQVPEIRSKQARRYQYNDIRFDSKPELAYYIWLIDNKIQFEFQPNISFAYIYNNTVHQYIPDFKVGTQIVEIKGDQFFKADGTMQNPYDHSLDGLYEAKHQCMIHNNVRIIRTHEYEAYIQYVNQKYGVSYLRKFRK